MNDILDIEGLLGSPKDKLILILLIVFILGLIILSIFYFYKRWRNKLVNQKLSPHEKALKSLSYLDQTNYLKSKDYKKYYFLLSEILRQYLEDKFQYPAVEKTTGEISADFQEYQLIPMELKNNILLFLKKADLIKFANESVEQNIALEDRIKLEQWAL